MPGPAPVPADRLHFALPPTHESLADERRYRKERLAGALRIFGRFGYEDGVSGHLTVADPELEDHYWVNPFGVPFAHLTVGDLLLADGEGRVVEGGRPVNQAAFTVHAEVHRARPETVAVAHCHSPYGRTLSTLGELLDPLTQESCAFFDDHVLYDDYTGVVVDAGEGRRIAAALGAHKAVILRNHGMLTVGDSVDAAAWWFITMERCARTQIEARSAGRPLLIDPKRAALTREQLGHDLAAWINYQPLWESVVRAEPDLLS